MEMTFLHLLHHGMGEIMGWVKASWDHSYISDLFWSVRRPVLNPVGPYASKFSEPSKAN
jgi:hypothetical protein